MKTAEQWAKEYATADISDFPHIVCEVRNCGCEIDSCDEVKKYARAIQRDAIKAAAAVSDRVRPELIRDGILKLLPPED